jgi:hypothetical protein
MMTTSAVKVMAGSLPRSAHHDHRRERALAEVSYCDPLWPIATI